MSVNNNYSINSYIANGILTDFSFDFEVLSISNLVVNVKDTDGNVSLQVLGVDYTATINSDGTGQISFAVAPANNYVVYIARNIPETQENNFETSSGFQAGLIEKSLDKLTMITQQLSEVNNRIIEISQFADIDAKGEIKEIADNKCLVWKDNGDGSLSIYASENNPDEVYNDIVNNPNVIAVGTNIDNVNNVATNSTNINSVAGDLTNIDNVAGDLTNINNVAGDLNNVDIVATDIANVNANATNISDINTNATNISNINIVATNISDIQDKANKDLDNITNTGKDNIINLVGIKKINEFNIENGDTEVEITGIGQKETIIDIDGLYANSTPCNLDSLLGNSGSYYNTNYFVSIMAKDNASPSNWLTNSFGTVNIVNTLSQQSFSSWSLSPSYPAKLHLEISKVIGNTIYMNGNCQLITTDGNYLENNIINNALVQNDLNVDRIKIFLNGSTFKAGNVRIYEKI